jgi:hypothetical protein
MPGHSNGINYVHTSISSSNYVYVSTYSGPYQSYQICALSASAVTRLLRIETSNIPSFSDCNAPLRAVKAGINSNAADYYLTGSSAAVDQYWVAETSGTFPNFAAAATPVSQMMHVGNLGSRFTRIRIDVDAPGVYLVAPHGKE